MDLGLSQAQVAEKLGITQTAYAVWERHPVGLKPEQIVEVCKVLQISPDYLFGMKSSRSQSGPVGKLRRVFDEVSALPRSRQQRIVATVEDMLTAAQRATG